MKLIQKNGMIGIDKAEIDELLAAKKFIGLNKSPRAEKVIVSLTSYDLRINEAKYAIYSLLNQSFPPDKLILWLDEDSFPRREKDLPRDLLELRDFGLTIDWCENLRSYKKLIPALEKYPDDIIVTADDDIFYRPDWLSILYEEHLKNPKQVIAHYGYRLRINTLGQIYPLLNWHWFFTPLNSSMPMFSNSAGTGGGVLLKKPFLHPDALNRELFLKLAPLDDELWFWAMMVLNNVKTFFPTRAINRIICTDFNMQVPGKTLWSQNKTKKDIQLQSIIKRYPILLDKLIREAVTFKPYISVVLPVRNPATISANVENMFRQKFPDYELILINLGSRINLPTLPTNFQVVNYPKASVATALNLGLQKASGDYVMFADENSIFSDKALEVVAKTADDSKADVIHFAGYLQSNNANKKFVLDDSPMLENDKPTLFNAPKQLRADFWLQNKLSRRLDTKIFKREFLLKYDIDFGNDLKEFMFQALIQAEKYLIVPGAFCFCK